MATTWSKRFLASSACTAYVRHGSLRLDGDTRADDGSPPGTAAATRPPHASTPTPAAAITGSPTTMPAAVPTPNSTMPSGDMIAFATRGVKNRSRKLLAMSAVRTSGASRIRVVSCGGAPHQTLGGSEHSDRVTAEGILKSC